jgi:hypothetical protein
MKNVECRLSKVFEYLNANDKLASVVKATQEKFELTEQELRVASESLRADSSENRWVLLSSTESIEEWVRDGFKLTFHFEKCIFELSVFKPYGMIEKDRICYFNTTYMKEFGGGKTIDDLNQVSWSGIRYNIEHRMSSLESAMFKFIFLDYMK